MTAPPLLPPSRRHVHSDVLLCVVAGCSARAAAQVRVTVGGREREVGVCQRHAAPRTAPEVPAR